jgi:YVTN family beta-propeller protein
MRVGKLFVLGLVLALAIAALPRAESSSTTRIYTSLEDRGQIVVIDPGKAQVLARISVGKRPRGIKLSPDRKLLYVALSGSPAAGPGVDESKLPPPDRTADGIGVIDLSSYKLLRTFSSGQDPETFDVSPDGKRLFVSNEETAEITVLELPAGRIAGNVQVGKEPEGVSVHPDGKFIYVACEGDSEVVAIDAGTLKVVSRMRTLLRPRSIVFNKDGSTAFVTDERSAAVTVLDGFRHRTIGTIAIPSASKESAARPMGAVLSHNGKYLFISNGRDKSIAVINVSSRRVLRTINDVGARPWGIGVSADDKHIYTANGPSNDVSVLEVDTGTIKTRIKVDGGAWGLVVADP